MTAPDSAGVVHTLCLSTQATSIAPSPCLHCTVVSVKHFMLPTAVIRRLVGKSEGARSERRQAYRNGDFQMSMAVQGKGAN